MIAGVFSELSRSPRRTGAAEPNVPFDLKHPRSGGSAERQCAAFLKEAAAANDEYIVKRRAFK